MAMNMQAMLRIVAQVEGQNAVQRLGAELAGVGRKAGEAISPFGQLNGAMRGIANVASTIGLAAVGRELLNAGSESLAATTKIKALATSYGEVKPLTDMAAQAAKQFALGNVDAKNAVADLYGRLRPMGVSLKDVETVFFGVNKAAKTMGLSTEDVNGVMLQLSQALGSGRLQGDELRSIMERMPAVGQAVAEVMGVSASEIKKLGSEGKITTEIMIQAAAELNKLQPPPPTAMQQFEKAMKDLRSELGDALLPILTPFIEALTALVIAFSELPEPLQTAIVGLLAFAIAAGPIASIVTGIGNALMLLGGLKIGATIAGWAGAIIPLKAAFAGFLAWIGGTLIPGLLAFFSGPVGWTVLAVAAVVAMAIAFREPLMNFVKWLWEWGKPIRKFWIGLWEVVRTAVSTVFSWIGTYIEFSMKTAYALAYQVFVQPWINLWDKVLREPVGKMWEWLKGVWGGISEWWTKNVTDPIGKAWENLTQLLPKAMENVAKTIKGVFDGIVNGIKSAIRNVLQFVANNINKIGAQVNKLIASFNRLPGPDIPLVPTLSVPAFAEGGIVRKPTLALVGEGGEPEYIIPESKMAATSAQYLADKYSPQSSLIGDRAASDHTATIAKILQGSKDPTLMAQSAQGYHRAMVDQIIGRSTSGSYTIKVETGPVMKFESESYVRLKDLMKATEEAAKQAGQIALDRLKGDPALRRSIGIA